MKRFSFLVSLAIDEIVLGIIEHYGWYGVCLWWHPAPSKAPQEQTPSISQDAAAAKTPAVDATMPPMDAPVQDTTPSQAKAPMQKIQTKTYVKVRLEYRGAVPTDRQSFNIVPGATYHGQDEVGSVSLVPEPPFTFLLELDPGTYSIVEEGRPKAHLISASRKAWSTPLATITVVLGPPMDLLVIIPAD